MTLSSPFTPTIRLATEADTEKLLDIYAPYIDTPVTFEEEIPTHEAFLKRVRSILATYPYLIAEFPAENKEGSPRIVGYAYAHAQATRAAFRWNAELSVYLAPQSQGYGLGTHLYATLIELLRFQGIKTAFASVTLPNPASERLHTSFAFQVIGVQKNAGYTCGAWHDVAWLAKPLATYTTQPAHPVPFPLLQVKKPQEIQAFLDKANKNLLLP